MVDLLKWYYIGLAVAWEGLFVFDSIVFGLTVFKAYRERQEYVMTRISSPLVTLMLRDGKV
jgi:hypothetical protein